VGAEPSLDEGDWVAIDYDLPTASIATGVSQYELLTGLAQRFERVWV
jgi:alanine racemase